MAWRELLWPQQISTFQLSAWSGVDSLGATPPGPESHLQEIVGRRDTLRDRQDEALAQFLGWFSIGLGVAELLAPRRFNRMIGAKPDGMITSLVGLREIAAGL